MLGFLDTLCGSRASELKVKDMEKYAFDPRRLLYQISMVLLRVWQQDRGKREKDGFLVALATHPDFSQATLGKCASVLQKQKLVDPNFLTDYTCFMQEVPLLNSLVLLSILFLTVMAQLHVQGLAFWTVCCTENAGRKTWYPSWDCYHFGT